MRELMKTYNEIIMWDIMVTGFVCGTKRQTNDHF